MNAGAGRFIQAITEFIFVSDEPENADIIFVPGSMYPEHVWRAAELYREGFAPLIMPCGKYGIHAGQPAPLKEKYAERYPGDYRTEYDFMKRVLTDEGVPERAILQENESTFTWENALFAKKVTENARLRITRAILCCKPYHARRALLYYQTAFPETSFIVCPAKEASVTADNWYKTEHGRNKVFSEVEKLGGQVRPQAEILLEL